MSNITPTSDDRKTKIPQGEGAAPDDPPEVGRVVTGFYYPAVKSPTGVVQFRNNAAEVVTIDRLGDVRRGQVIAISKKNPPNAAALDFARGLVASGNFSHVDADTPLGQPDEYKPKPRDIAGTVETKPDGSDPGTKVGDFAQPTGDVKPLPRASAQRISIDLDNRTANLEEPPTK